MLEQLLQVGSQGHHEDLGAITDLHARNHLWEALHLILLFLERPEDADLLLVGFQLLVLEDLEHQLLTRVVPLLDIEDTALG